MSRKSLLQTIRSSSLLCLLILITVLFSNCVSFRNELRPKVSLFTNGTTLVYEFNDSPSITQILRVRQTNEQKIEKRGLLLAGTNFLYLLKDPTYQNATVSKNTKVPFYFFSKDQFPNGAAFPVNEIKVLTAINEYQFFVCGTINDGKCYLLLANLSDLAGMDLFRLESDDSEKYPTIKHSKYDYLGYSKVECEKEGYYQNPLNCSQFYTCLPTISTLGLGKSDCPFYGSIRQGK